MYLMTDKQKRDLIKKSLIRSIAELQNHLENTRAKLRRAKEYKDFSQVITYRGQKKRIEISIKDYTLILRDYES